MESILPASIAYDGQNRRASHLKLSHAYFACCNHSFVGGENIAGLCAIGTVAGRQQPAAADRGEGRADQLRGDKARQIRRSDAGKRVGQRTRDGHCRIGKRRGRGKPVRRRDVEPDQEWDRRPPKPETREDRHNQPERRDRLGEPLPAPRADPR